MISHKTSAVVVIMSVGAFAMDSAKAAEIAYAWANQPAATQYAPDPNYVFNDGQPVQINRDGLGQYRVSFGRLASAGANVQVQIYGTDAGYCNTRRWGSGTVHVRCFNAGGAPADRRFSVLTIKGAAGEENQIAYAWLNNASAATYQADASYRFGPGDMQVTRTVVGNYKVNLASNVRNRNIALSTGYGTNARCDVTLTTLGRVQVTCLDPSEAGVDARASALLLREGVARMSIASNVAEDGELSAAHGVSSDGSAQSVERTGVGRYRVTLGPEANPGGHVQVSPLLTRAHCWAESWGGGDVNVRCMRNGALRDATFAVMGIARGAAGGTGAPPLVTTLPPGAIALLGPITLPTVQRVRPWPSERFYVIKTGAGDNDFAGNGPRVTASATISHNDKCINLRMSMDALETESNYTRGLANVQQTCIWEAPADRRIRAIRGPLTSSIDYTDTDWQIDVIVPGRGEVDGARDLPAADAGPVHAFLIMGDTNGDVISNSNDNDGNDVGPQARHKVDDRIGALKVDGWGNPLSTHPRTSLQVTFNEFEVELDVLETPPPATEQIFNVFGLATPFFAPAHIAGDNEFGGNGPAIDLSARVYIEDGARLESTISMTAQETGGDTRAEGYRSFTLWTAPPGWRLADVGRRIDGAFVSVNGRTFSQSYVDDDHEIDFVVPGYGEEKNIKDGKRWISEGAEIATKTARSPVWAFVLTGDVDGGEAGSRTGVRTHFLPLELRVEATDATRASLDDLGMDVFLDVPDRDWTLQLSGGNSCGPSAGSRVLRYYGADTSYELFKRRVLNSDNAFADQSNGTPPGTLRDRMNDVVGGFRQDVLPLGNGVERYAAITRIKEFLDEGKPVIALIGWGSNHLYNVYAQHQDSDAGSLLMHYVVIRGYDDNARTFSIVDNGHQKHWSFETFMSVFDYGINPAMEVGAAGFANVQKGSIIYRNR